jgi:hypothetical protein
LSCSGGGFEPVEDNNLDTTKTSNMRSLCLQHLNDADVSTRSYLKVTSSIITDVNEGATMAVPSGNACVVLHEHAATQARFSQTIFMC